MAELSPADRHKSHDMGLHAEQLAGRTQQVFFYPEEGDNYTYPEGFDVDFTKKATIDAAEMDGPAVNLRIRELMGEGYGHIVVQNPLAKHSLGVGILNRLKLDFEGSLGYFGCGLVDGPNIHIKGRVGWSCAENMMAGVVVIEKNAGSTFGAALRGGDLVCKGDVGSRTGIDMKGGTIIIRRPRRRVYRLHDAARAHRHPRRRRPQSRRFPLRRHDLRRRHHRLPRRRCRARRDHRCRGTLAREEARDLWPGSAQRRRELEQDRRRQAALELRHLEPTEKKIAL